MSLLLDRVMDVKVGKSHNRPTGLGILGLVIGAFLLGWWWRGSVDSSGRESPTKIIPTFSDPIGITSGNDGLFVAFLEEHVGQLVFLSTYLDLSVSLEQQAQMEQQFQVHDFLENPTTPLPLAKDGRVMLALERVAGRSPPISHGGTGIVQVQCIGYFRISRTAASGPSTVFHLREIAETISTPTAVR
jgi:hypothetical protein